MNAHNRADSVNPLDYAIVYTSWLSPNVHRMVRPFSGCLLCPPRPRCATHNEKPQSFYLLGFAFSMF